jgi:hypothetical protein
MNSITGTRRFWSGTVLLTAFVLLHFQLNAQSAWTRLDNSRVVTKGQRAIDAKKYLSYHLDLQSYLTDFVRAAESMTETGKVVDVPMPDGSFSSFSISYTRVMHPDLATRYPSIKTFVGQGIDDRTAMGRFDFTQFGFHGMILSSTGTSYIDPVSLQDSDIYMVYRKSDFITAKEFICHTAGGSLIDSERLIAGQPSVAKSVGTELKTYRLAMAATGEYTAFYGGTVPGAMAGIVTSVNRVTGVFERELAIRMELVPNNDTLVFTNATTDPYTNSNGSAMLNQNQTTVMARIGGTNFDIGHVFSTGGGGIAGLAVVCIFNSKARGVTGSPSPINDPFDIDYVAHEIGHQYGGNHTFNCEVGACSGNRAFTAAYEPGSGSTIMAYAGICGSNNLQSNSDDYFHAKSFDEIVIYTTTGLGGACDVVTPTGNTPPVINPGLNYIIPYLTPFRLTGSATDPDGDPLTYCWEQYNLGPAGVWNNPVGNAPIFRSFDPVPESVRLFPKLSNILNNNQTIGEVKPSYARVLAFKLTVRDNRINGGGVTSSDSLILVDVINTGQAFAITAPNTTGIVWQSGGLANVTWDVGGSDLAPISTPNVNILLSTDGGQSFPTVLASGVPNTGSFSVNVPAIFTTTARVMVEGAGNIFFDINDKNFEIGTVGIGETAMQAGVQIAPNPAGSQFVVTFTNATVVRPDSRFIRIFDLSGRRVSEKECPGVSTIVDTREWNSGMYFYRIESDREVICSGKLIVQ